MSHFHCLPAFLLYASMIFQDNFVRRTTYIFSISNRHIAVTEVTWVHVSHLRVMVVKLKAKYLVVEVVTLVVELSQVFVIMPSIIGLISSTMFMLDVTCDQLLTRHLLRVFLICISSLNNRMYCCSFQLLGKISH